MLNALALDLDGTVLNSHHQISAYLKKTVTEIAKKYPVFIVTGRHHAAARPYHQQLGLTTPIICCNGTYAYNYAKDEAFLANPINREHALMLYEHLISHALKTVVYTRDYMAFDNKNPPDYIQSLIAWAATNAQEYDIIRGLDDLRQEILNHAYIWKMVVEGDGVEAIMQDSDINQYFVCEQSWHNRFDISAIGNTKGSALVKLLAELDLSDKKVVAVGDNYNDISMFKVAEHSIAMANAAANVKAHSISVTEKSNDDDNSLADTLASLFLSGAK
ncbi:HAD family hydrolase [Thorsellia anophelis]|uniref:Cof subfamily of IIB subfamily of haloacid dehalogenase superfamily/HAD-superfamily hydrolase, subfamily IIB n=1 Tax=Thorsellia anophelis DSM 18579 TaxID=1123402 RepID=A0A1I0B7D7_9GAMM|nr:HAD family hydrolase [Thorsellia anophelis]SET02711.1 hypothetical protein SAMN02583745_01171 [Thorsellia anophelis DSM 18579]